MGTVARTAGAAGSISLTVKNTAGQLITPVSAPSVKWYTDAARTLGEVTLTTTGSGSSYTSTWTAGQAPATPATRYLKVTIEVSTAIFDIDADDEIGFVDAVAQLGNTYVTLAEVRAMPAMLDLVRYPDAKVTAAIAWFETKWEGYVGAAFVSRTTTQRLSGSGTSSLILGHYPVTAVSAVRVYSAAATSVAFTSTELADLVVAETGIITRFGGSSFPAGHNNIGVDYTYGFITTPEDIRDVALVAIADKLMSDATAGARANRQFSVATQDGIVRSSMPGPDRPYGIPTVDQAANDYRARYRVPAVA